VGGGFPIRAPEPLVTTGPFDGVYTGTAVVKANTNFACGEQIPLGGFRVDGNTIRFGGFRGKVEPDGSASLSFGRNQMNGRFTGNTFHGEVTLITGSHLDWVSCTYRADLSRVAP